MPAWYAPTPGWVSGVLRGSQGFQPGGAWCITTGPSKDGLDRY